jgi:fibro-slime domain-containing protein
MSSKYAFFLLSVAAGCSEYQVHDPPNVAAAKPPGSADEFGDPPDWNTCQAGWDAQYVNLTVDDPEVTPPRGFQAPDDPSTVDWWDDVAFEGFDPSLDMGENWWPVDEGLEADPAYFAVHWFGWLRAVSSTDMQITFGSADDAWVVMNDEIIAALPGIHEFEPQTLTVHVDAGQYPVEVFFAHRKSAVSGFRFRILSGDVIQCYADYSEQTGG